MERFKESILLQARIQNFSESEVLHWIQPNVLHEILQKDHHPFFQAYSIAHEGISHSKLLGIGGKIIEWSKDAIKSIGKVIKNGIKCFHGHNRDNSITGRKELGEIVGHVEKEIDGKLNSIAIIYHPENVKQEVKEFDICSQESDWNFEEKDGKLYAVDCEDITAIAFDNSQNNKPAFEGAKRLAMVQCFEEEKKEVKPMTFEDVKKSKAELNVFASQLYSFDEIKKDREFAKIFEKYEADIKIANDEKSAKEKEIERLKGIEKENLKLTQKNRLESILKKDSINLTDEEKLFVFADESINRNNDPSDDGLKIFLQLRRDDYKLYQKINSKDENIDLSNVEKKTEKIDYGDPKNNDMI